MACQCIAFQHSGYKQSALLSCCVGHHYYKHYNKTFIAGLKHPAATTNIMLGRASPGPTLSTFPFSVSTDYFTQEGPGTWPGGTDGDTII